MKKAEALPTKKIQLKCRKKPTKSCSFCRLRKLKCDRERPLCGSCSSRRYKCCNYNESEISKDEQLRAKYRKFSKHEMAQRIEELESCLKLHVPDPISEVTNPLRSIRYLSSKHNRHILYGATSYRTLLTKKRTTFTKFNDRIWNVLKSRRKNWKLEHKYSTLAEISSIEAVTVRPGASSLIQSLCDALPSYEIFLLLLDQFFGSNFYKCYQIVSEQKVRKDLRRCLVKGSRNPETNSHPIKSLNIDAKKNYYMVGVITMILCLVSYPNQVPEPIETFHKLLTSFVTAKVFYIERVQFLFLRSLYVNLVGIDGGDQSHCIFLHGLTIDTAIHLGLHEDMRLFFVEKDHPVEEIPFLEKLWLWLLFADIRISFSTGIPLRISEEFVDDSRISNSTLSTDMQLRLTIVKLRKIMRKIHCRLSTPNLPLIIEDLKSFADHHYKPRSSYLDPANLNGTEFTELQLWLLTLQILVSLANLQRICFEDDSPLIFNTSVLLPLDTLRLCFKVLEGYLALDNRESKSDFDRYFEKAPNLNMALFLIHMNGCRALAEIYSVLLQYLEYKEADLWFTSKKSESISSSMNTGEPKICGESYVTLEAIFQKLKKVFNDMHYGKLHSSRSVWQNSYYFSNLISMENIGRKVFEKAIKKLKDGLENGLAANGHDELNFGVALSDIEGFVRDYTGEFTEDTTGFRNDLLDIPNGGWDNLNDELLRSELFRDLFS